MEEQVNHPSHYSGEIECIDAMIQQFGKEAVLSFCELNAFKYQWRAHKKHDSPKTDLEKANWYINKWLELY